MKLKTKLILLLISVFLLSLCTIEIFRYYTIKTDALNDLYREARSIRNVLMATRRVYHHQFLESGVPLTEKTIGFLPAHAMSRISRDFINWTTSDLYFNNVSDRPRNLDNAADLLEQEAISYFRENPTERERFVPFNTSEKKLFYHFAAPIWVEEYCLKCHGKREDAPVTIRTNYATSFDYNAGELRGVMSIKLPANHLNARIWNNFTQDLWVHLASFFGMFLLISWMLNRYVNKPLKIITSGLETVAGGNLDYSVVGLSGEMAIVSNAFNNMSERLRKRENALKESEARYQAMFKTSNVGMTLCKIDGTPIEYNEAYLDIIGYTKEEALQLTYWDITPIEFKENEDMQLHSLAEIGCYGPYEKEYIQKNGNRIPVLLNGTKFKGVDDNEYIFSIVQNITDRKKMEKALSQSEKLKSIGTITAGISHEFNNILAIISGSVQLLEVTYKDHGDLTDALRTIKKATDDGAKISRKMLEFTRTAPDTKEFVSSDIRDLIIQSIDFTKPRWKNEAQARGIDYKIDTEGMKSVLTILCNPTELREVFINLIINALDAMPEGGTIAVATRCVRREELGVQSEKAKISELKSQNSELKGDFVEIIFADTGEGMSEEVKKNIFDPFFTTKTPVGTGLGMSTAYGIIARHGGKIEVESKAGKGSTFKLQFPIATKTVSPIATSGPEQEIKNKCLDILVVDDEEAICNILDTFLSRNGHKVKTVNNGADAINIIKTENFDLVLCDLAMPDVFGYEVIKVLNGLEKRPKIGVITGWGEKLNAIGGVGMKADFVARKPFNFSELTKNINEAFGV